MRTPGRKIQTLKEASFDAWIKFYKPDENSPNVTVSYYLKGALLAFCCDIWIRKNTGSAKSLDNVMMDLWNYFGKPQAGVQKSVQEKDIQEILKKYGGEEIKELIASALETTEELPLSELFPFLGLELNIRKPVSLVDWGNVIDNNTNNNNINTLESNPRDFIFSGLGLKLVDNKNELLITNIYSNSAAEKAGCQVGDVMVALDNQRLTPQNYLKLFDRCKLATIYSLSLFRQEKLCNINIIIEEIPENTADIIISVFDETHRNFWLKTVKTVKTGK
jgi:predicted metalloprotease with PDZ domain